MQNFAIINNEGERLLKELDTAALQSFLNHYQTNIVESEEFQSPEEIRAYFQGFIAQTLATEKVKNIASSQIESYLHGYTMVGEILCESFPELEEDRPEIYNTL